jgi:hypothetical protein
MPRRYLRRNTASHIRSVNTGGAEFRRGPVDQSGRGIAGSCPTTEAKRQFLFPLPTCVVYPFLCPSAAAYPTLRGRGYGGMAHASTESAGRSRPKSPILYGSWPGGGSDADATDH